MSSVNNKYNLIYNSQPDGDTLSFYHDNLKIDIPIANKRTIIQEAALEKLKLNNGFLNNRINSKIQEVAFSDLTKNAQNELEKLVTIVETKPSSSEEIPDISSLGIDIILNREGGHQ